MLPHHYCTTVPQRVTVGGVIDGDGTVENGPWQEIAPYLLPLLLPRSIVSLAAVAVVALLCMLIVYVFNGWQVACGQGKLQQQEFW